MWLHGSFLADSPTAKSSLQTAQSKTESGSGSEDSMEDEIWIVGIESISEDFKAEEEEEEEEEVEEDPEFSEARWRRRRWR